MQVFVRRSSLTLTADEAVSVMGYFDDAATLPPAMLRRTDFTLLSLANGAILPGMGLGSLAPGWREANRAQIVSGEATRRIDAVFPEYSQRNSIAEMNGYIVSLGVTATAWPTAPQRRKAEIDRAWSYVNAVRASADGMLKGALPADPTNDSHWPTRATAYQSG